MTTGDGDVIVTLRETAEVLPHEVYSWLHPLLIGAADEIERLRAALREVVSNSWEDSMEDWYTMPTSTMKVVQRAIEQNGEKVGEE